LIRRFGVRDAHPLEQVRGHGHRVLALDAAVTLQHLGHLETDRDDRVERGQRVLEDHRDVLAAPVPHVVVGQCEQVGALVVDGAGDLVAALGEQPHDRQRGHRLAASGLADQTDGLSGAHREAHTVHGP
jgi:hypothetical protein